jgi:hypothetical protein
MDQTGSGQNAGPTPPPVESVGTTSGAVGVAAVRAAQPSWNDSFGQLDAYADQLRLKLPLAPPGLLSGYMSIAPWVAVVFGVLGILISLVALVGSTVLGPLLILFGSPGTGFALLAGSIVALVTAALEVVGGWMMVQRKATGWWLLALGLLVSLLSNLFRGSIVALLIVVVVAYVHLQVKPNYR